MKHLIILLLGCLSTCCCLAQEISEDNPATTSNTPRSPQKITAVAVTFIPTDTCNLRINAEDHGAIFRNSPKTIKLPLGNYKLLFESLETGECIRKRSFRLTRDSLTNGKYTYRVTFKQRN